MKPQDLIKLLQLHTAKSDPRKVLQNIHLHVVSQDSLFLVATDGHSIIRVPLNENTCHYEHLRTYLINSHLILSPEIPKTGQIIIASKYNKVDPSFDTEQKYPDYEKVIPIKLTPFNETPSPFILGFEKNICIQKTFKILKIQSDCFVPDGYSNTKAASGVLIGVLIKILENNILLGVMPLRIHH